MNEATRIALTGFMGVGKSSVSRHLAHILRCRRIDLDTFIEDRQRRKVADIIDTDGIEHYRAVETQSLEAVLLGAEHLILSLGGGTWTVGKNRDLIKAHGFTSVWLE